MYNITSNVYVNSPNSNKITFRSLINKNDHFNNSPKNIKEKIYKDINKRSNEKENLQDLDFDVSELTPNNKFEDSFELHKKRSERSSKKKKIYFDPLVIQNENSINITGKSCVENSSNQLHDREIKKSFMVNQEIHDKKISQSKEEYKVVVKEDISLVTEERNETKLMNEIKDNQENFKKKTETFNNSIESSQSSEMKKRVNFSSENKIINFKEKLDVNKNKNYSPGKIF